MNKKALIAVVVFLVLSFILSIAVSGVLYYLWGKNSDGASNFNWDSFSIDLPEIGILEKNNTIAESDNTTVKNDDLITKQKEELAEQEKEKKAKQEKEEKQKEEQEERDRERKSDIDEIEFALAYADHDSDTDRYLYPSAKEMPDKIEFDFFGVRLDPVPQDPSGNKYLWQDNTDDNTKYCIAAKMEIRSDAYYPSTEKKDYYQCDSQSDSCYYTDDFCTIE